MWYVFLLGEVLEQLSSLPWGGFKGWKLGVSVCQELCLCWGAPAFAARVVFDSGAKI